MILFLFIPYLIYGVFNGTLNVCKGKNYTIRVIAWSVVWFPIFIIDHYIMGNRSLYSSGEWKWL